MPKVLQSVPAPPTTKTITITLSEKSVEALKDYRFWTGESDSKAVDSAIEHFMESVGEMIMWNLARDPVKRQAAFDRNNLAPDVQAGFSRKLDADIEKSRKASQRQHKKLQGKQQRISTGDAEFLKSMRITLD